MSKAFPDLKAKVLAEMTRDQVREFGSIRRMATWELAATHCRQQAIARCRNIIANGHQCPVAASLYELVRGRIGLDCDAIEFSGNRVRFFFEQSSSLSAALDRLFRSKDPIVRAYMMGFTEYIFLCGDGTEFTTPKDFWIAKQRVSRRGRGRHRNAPF